MTAYITSTGSFLPGSPVSNDEIPLFLGTLDGEPSVREKILRMNGIKARHYALNQTQNPTHDLYEMGKLACSRCLNSVPDSPPATYLSSGSTNSPLVATGISSILHSRLADSGCLNYPVEINSNAGICTSAAQSLINAIHAVDSENHQAALSTGIEQPSDILKSSVIQPVDDREEQSNLQKSQWFMSVFLRSMLSDGAGAFLISGNCPDSGLALKVDWSFSRSYAFETPLCMKLENRSLLLSQDVTVLGEFMKPSIHQFIEEALNFYNEDLGQYKWLLPHLSSFYFKRLMLTEIRHLSPTPPKCWTNLADCGNTGAASIYIMLDQFLKQKSLSSGERLLLFIPESGQFNFVMISLTVVNEVTP